MASNCPTDQQLGWFLSGELTDELLESVAEHLENCAKCRTHVDQWEEEASDVIHVLRKACSPEIAAETSAYERMVAAAEATVGSRLHVRCVECHTPIDLTPPTSLRAIECASCGSRFNLLADESSERDRTSQVLGHYQLLEKIGTGSHGAVWRAHDTELDRTVAVKIPRFAGLDPIEGEAFLREARAAAQLHHPNIVGVYEVGRQNGTVFIVSDFVDGLNLADWLADQQLAIREAAQLCAKLANALDHAHQAGVIHRDLKPSNIMMDVEGSPHLMDFGLARRQAGEVTMTQDGKILGTPAYMSPEQARGEAHQADRRSDIYSLGVILFELLTGERPFRGSTQMLLKQIVEAQPPSPRSLNARIPRDLETICLKCLENAPAQRYPTAKALSEDLRRFLVGEPIRARRVTTVGRIWRWCQRNRVVAALGTALAVSVICGLTGLAVMKGTHDQQRANALVDAALAAPAEALPFAITNLQPVRDLALVRLNQRFQDISADNEVRLHAAVALAAFGQVELDSLIDSISTARDSESQNIVSSLGSFANQAIPPLRDRFASEQDLEIKSRWAITLLFLHEPGAAADMLKLRADPIQRTVFIDRFPLWHGKLLGPPWEQILTQGDATFRSGLCAALGSISAESLSTREKESLGRTLGKLLQRSPDSATHSAAGWAVRKWNIPLPRLESGQDAQSGFEWFVNTLGMTMLKLPAGRYTRIDPVDRSGMKRQDVVLTRAFYLSDREVSIRQFMAFVEDEHYPQEEKPRDWSGPYRHFSPTVDCPVEHLNWFDIVLFCNWLSRKEGLAPRYERTGESVSTSEGDFDAWRVVEKSDGYRLPTEAEWEYACRAGTTTTFAFGHDESYFPSYGIMLTPIAKPCGSRIPNVWGLFDMHGNMWEFCEDWNVRPYPGGEEVVDPRGPEIADKCVVRGGSFLDTALAGQSGSRASVRPGVRAEHYGFRVARTARD